MLIKICGMKEPGNVKEVAALHPDMLGFNCMGMNPLKWVTILYGKATG